ncbi:hypothetical protein GAP32_504 [Cronobacter phage vB_CsaM_GAP32]|uniref:Uncharacterized protein n=1 Tax=Cronobacter phage vB_CsaM_GAP32 TaxID=1141136 RepID=K4FB97_9CAUD|nr:hypothetical protein GAP32_504 [Cronobacter phage vB_CsaM_GAP32]AFC21964.1 hypothetical protein GAP32_504 [Cronobacter phage vB_CsaM_GAP32]
MGTIYLAADLSDVTEDNVSDFCFDKIECSELENIPNIDAVRAVLVKSNISREMQDHLNSLRQLSKEECLSILEHSDRVYTSRILQHQYDLDVIYKYLDKLDICYVETQDSLDAQFVEKYYDDMDMSGFVKYRAQLGDIDKFMNIPMVWNYYAKRVLNYDTPIEEVEQYIRRLNPNVNVDVMHTVLNKLYLTPVNATTLAAAYSNRNRSSHSVDTVVNYYNRNHGNSYENWFAYVADGERQNETALIDVWFKDHFMPELRELANVQN